MSTQIERAERLQDLWLEHMEKLLQSGAITSTDLATLARVLMHNGWVLDRSRLPKGLADKLIDPITDDEFADVLPLRKRG